MNNDTKIINGIKHSKNLTDKIKELVLKSEKLNNRKPSIAVILIGENPASEIYVKNKIKIAENIGIISKKISYPSSISFCWFNSLILFNNSFSVIEEWYTIFFDIIPIFSAVLILFLIYISLAEFSPIKITAIEGLRLLSLSDFKTNSLIFSVRFLECFIPLMIFILSLILLLQT